MDECIGARMTRETCLEALLKNFVQLRLQGVNVADTRGALSHPFGLLFPELEEVEIVAAVRDVFGARERLVGNREEGKAGRKGERFLRAGEHHVDAECVHVDLDAGER